MGKHLDKNGTETVRLDTTVLEVAREYKRHTGISIGRFIEDAIFEKYKRIPKNIREKMVIENNFVNERLVTPK